MSDEKIHERVNEKVRDNVRKEAREAAREAGNTIIKKLVDKGFRDGDVRTPVRNGLLDAMSDLAK